MIYHFIAILCYHSNEVETMRWKRVLPYLLLNVLVSAFTTLLVLWLWSRSQSSSAAVPTFQPLVNATLVVTVPPLPPLDQPVIEIENVFGAGDLNNEVVRLKRIGKGDLWLNGWKMMDENRNMYTFGNLNFISGTLEVYTRAGINTATAVYWNQEQPVWSIGETVILLDSAGNLRAQYVIQ
jgi:hypothetical protein